MSIQKPTIVVLIPCLNEEITIGKVIRDFKKEIPEAKIIVFDNNSTDLTASIANESGAKVEKELRPGKGHVMASMFQKVDADYYVFVDGDQFGVQIQAVSGISAALQVFGPKTCRSDPR